MNQIIDKEQFPVLLGIVEQQIQDDKYPIILEVSGINQPDDYMDEITKLDGETGDHRGMWLFQTESGVMVGTLVTQMNYVEDIVLTPLHEEKTLKDESVINGQEVFGMIMRYMAKHDVHDEIILSVYDTFKELSQISEYLLWDCIKEYVVLMNYDADKVFDVLPKVTQEEMMQLFKDVLKIHGFDEVIMNEIITSMKYYKYM